MGVLYQLTSPSGKRYIGITSQRMDERWRQHIAYARQGIGWPICRAIRKYGAESFKVRVLAQVEDSEMFELERRAIEVFGTRVPGGYNVTAGGEGTLGAEVSRETREKASRRMKGRQPACIATPESRARAGRAMREVWNRPGYRERVSMAMSIARMGMKPSEETRKKQSEAQKRRWVNGVPDDFREKGRRSAEKRWGQK